jgi:hypothetical protein
MAKSRTKKVPTEVEQIKSLLASLGARKLSPAQVKKFSSVLRLRGS